MPLTFMVGIGVVVSLGILLDTFVTRSLLVPALSLHLGDRFWWPGPVPGPAPDDPATFDESARVDLNDSLVRRTSP